MDKKQEFKVGQKLKTKQGGEVEVTAVNTDGSCECKCTETGERKVLTKEDVQDK